MAWELKDLKGSKEIDCVVDDSGIYTVINRIDKTEHLQGHMQGKVFVRVDIMSTDDEPLQSFVGEGNNVRKHVIKWLWNRPLTESNCISSEHASYIGYEISRALFDEYYKQN